MTHPQGTAPLPPRAPKRAPARGIGLISFGVAAAFLGVFGALSINRGTTSQGVFAVGLLLLLLALLFLPLVMVIRQRLSWSDPASVISLYGLIGFGVPALYHILARDEVHFGTPMGRASAAATRGDYNWLLIHVLLCFVIALWIAMRWPEDRSGGLQRRWRWRESGNFSLWLGIGLSLAGLFGLYMLYGGLEGYVRQFWRMGLREAPELSTARYLYLAEFLAPGVMMTYVSISRRLRRGSGLNILVLVIAIGIGVLPVANRGGRSVLVQYVLMWILVIHLGMRPVRIRRLLPPGILLFLAVLVVDRVRAVTYSAKAQAVTVGYLLKHENLQRGPMLLNMDKFASTMFTFSKSGDWLGGETLAASWLGPWYRPLELVGLPLEFERPWSISQYHGHWLFGDVTKTGNPSSMVGEAYANFGTLGVVFGSLLLGWLAVALRRRSALLQANASRGPPPEGSNSATAALPTSPLVAVVTAMWIARAIPVVLMGGWGSVAGMILYRLVPLGVLVFIGRRLGYIR